MARLLTVLVGLLAIAGSLCDRVGQDPDVQTDMWARLTDISDIDETLRRQIEEFPQGITQMAPNIWIAVGYALANSILIVGDDGYIVVDTLDSYEPAFQVATLFQQFTEGKPLTGIIYTHDHPDHVSGTRAFIDVAAQSDMPQIWGYHTLQADFWEKWQYLRPQLMARSLRQIGLGIPNDVKVNSGLGPYYVFGSDTGLLLFPPTNVLEGDRTDITISGVDMTLVFIPGETKNQMGVYVKDRKAFCAGDDYYHTFPNLYAIRGTPPRPISDWMKSIDIMLGFDIEILLPSHTSAFSGASEVIHRLTVYRDAIQYVIDQTMRLINKGYHPNDIGLMVQLPDSIINEGNLEENYGAVEWSVKSVFESQLGWYSGFVEELYPVTLAEAGCRNLDMYGRRNGKIGKLGSSSDEDNCNSLKTDRDRGRCWVVEEGDRIVNDPEADETDLRWALTLISYAVNCDTRDYLQVMDSSSEVAAFLRTSKRVRGEIMIRLANKQPSPNGRNYLLVYTTEENGIGPFGGTSPNSSDRAPVLVLPFPQLLEKMKVMLIPAQVDGIIRSVQINMDGTCYRLIIRNSVMLIVGCSSNDGPYDLVITMDVASVASFRGVLLGDVSVADFTEQSGVDVVENNVSAAEFFGWYENADQQPLIPLGI